jgi:tetratricopeptide (TPR) repeat protein
LLKYGGCVGCVCTEKATFFQNNAPEARRLFELALRDSPRSRFVFLAWGELEAGQGDPRKARFLLRRGHKWNPQDAALLQAWARLEAREGKLDKARYLFGKGVQVRIVQHAPRTSLVHPSSSLRQACIEHPPHASCVGRRQVCDDHQPLYQAWGMLEWKDGNAEAARDLFQRGVWADPKNPNATRVFQVRPRAYAHHLIKPFRARQPTPPPGSTRAAARAPAPAPLPEPATTSAPPPPATIHRLRCTGLMGYARGTQAWGVLEGREGNTTLARQLFKCAVKADPQSVPSWQVSFLSDAKSSLGDAKSSLCDPKSSLGDAESSLGDA